MIKKFFIVLLLLLFFIPVINASHITVIYDSDNYVCNVSYATDANGYYKNEILVSGDTLKLEGCSIVILETEYSEGYLNENNILDKPHIIIPKIFSLFLILIFAYIAIQIIKRIRRLF